MAVRKKVIQVGGSLAVVIPKDLAEMMEVKVNSPVRLSLVGRQMVIEPEDDAVPVAGFRRAFATVLRRYGPAFEAMAKYDKTGRRR